MKELRKEKCFTLDELAEVTGLSNPYLSQIENKHKKPTISSIRTIAGSLEVTIIELMVRLGYLTNEDVDEYVKDNY